MQIFPDPLFKMASDRSPYNYPRRQEIPLQDLSRPPDESPSVDGGRRHRSTRSRNIFGNGRSFTGRVDTAYERVDEGSPPPRGGVHGLPHITTPRNAHQPYPYDEGEVSPVDAGGFATAMGSVGLSFEPSFEPPHEPAGPSRPTPGRRRSTLNPINDTNVLPTFAMTSTPMMNEPDSDQYFSPQDNDQTPLTDGRYLAPISGAPHSAPQSSAHSRMGSRLGDDLNMEAGRAARPSSTLGSIPPLTGSTLSRAGTMIRKASQRIVNLSNEPDAIDSNMRRQRFAPDGEGRMEAPPALPAMQDYAHDDRSSLSLPAEKSRPVVTSAEESESQSSHPNPLRGKSLGLFGPENWLRLLLCEVLVHPFTEPIILILIVIQTIVLIVDSAPSVVYGQRPMDWKISWANFVLLVLFFIYTLEIIVRIIVSGFVKNAEEYSTNDLDLPALVAIGNRMQSFFTSYRRPSASNRSKVAAPEPSILRSFTHVQVLVDQPGHSRQAQRLRLARRAFLRHGFNRLDFVAVISFWIYFVLAVTWYGPYHHIYVFKMLSCLRILRLLGLTNGTSVILRSLKKAAPLLVNVAFLISFFWLLFAIIGVQSFKASFRRTCVWLNQTDTIVVGQTKGSDIAAFEQFNWNAGANIQFCGGYINTTDKNAWPWLMTDQNDVLQTGTSGHKGYLCPESSLCLKGDGIYNGTVHFDNIGNSLELVFVILSANTFSDLLYFTTNSDFLAAALFFAFGIMIMTFWLSNLLVAVITSSFQVIREESKTSAFTADEEKYDFIEDEEPPVKISLLKRAYDRTYWLWIIIIVVDLTIMCLRSSTMGPDRAAIIDWTEKAVTFILDVEIALRLLTDWRNFHKSRHNWADLALAVITSVIQIRQIHDSGTPYAWLTFFQIIRIYRVVLAVTIIRELIIKVLGKASGLLNLIIFVFLLSLLTAIFAVQIFQGEFPPYDVNGNNVHMDFRNIYISFIGMYQVLSSENWTILMYNSTQYQQLSNSSWIGATFFILWFILANFIVLNMFIAFITENFDVSEDEKRLHQVKAFLQQKELGGSSHGNLSLSTMFKLGRGKDRHRDPLDYGPATMEMLLQEAVFRDFLDEQMEPMEELHDDDGTIVERPSGPVEPGLLSAIWNRILKTTGLYEPNPFFSGLQFSKVNEELDIRTQARQVVSAAEQRKKAQREYLLRHPRYNVSLFIFSPSNPVRRFCQRIVGPGRGSKRIEGVDPVKPVWYAFSAFIYAAIIAMVLIACVTTPLYQKEYFDAHGSNYNSMNWFTWTDMGFAVIFSLEALIKIIADGFFWTPNAFFRGSWGFVDGVVLVTLWISVVTSLYADGAVSRAVGAFKALRALRLLNVSDSARDTFHSVIVLGGWKVVSAAFVSLSLLFPFAIYGLNLFNGQMRNCNDNSFTGDLSNCVGEYQNGNLFNPNWLILQPRAALNPYYNFDDFGNSLSILFQIVSQEGWTDVMWTAMEAAGVNQNLIPYNSQGNAVFFIIFNLLGAVFVLTLFVSVFMRNYTEQTGVAFLTADQRSWLELRKLLRQINPSKRPSSKSENGWRAWCYRIAVKKHGRWQRWLTFVLCFHLLLLCSEYDPEPIWWQITRDMLFLAFTIFYIANVVVRIIGLTWKRFRKSSWDLYSIFSVTGTVITTLLDLSQIRNAYTSESYIEIYGQLHKLFLVSITLLLIPRNNQLDQLFKTAAASLSTIGNLLATWFVLFLVFAIALTQTFGLTRFGSQETGNLNFRTVPKALIVLFRMSCGESWNAIMEDFATNIPPSCVEDSVFYRSDCGSAAWARSLFIAWNILSMYIFVSLFVSLIFESFSYVYQRSSGLSVVTREEIRRFKQAWATFDPEGTGFIPADVFPRLLGELSGVFEMRIYAGGDHSVGRILENCRVEVRGSETPPPGTAHGVDLAELNRQLRMIDVHDVRRRRQRMEVFYQEIMVSAHPDRGVNFTSCLMILAHYNVISDSKSLRLEEYLRRRARLQRVEEEVNRRIVKGFFDMMWWTSKFQDRLNFRHSARMVQVPQFAVPEIFVDDQDAPNEGGQGGISEQDPFSDVPITIGPTHHRQGSNSQRPGRPSLDTSGIHHRGDTHSRGPSTSGERDNSLSPSASPHMGATLTPRRSPSHSAAAASGDFNWTLDGTTGGSFSPSNRSPTGGRSRATSNVNQNVLDVFDNSAWGESIKRSFTMRRSGTKGGRVQGGPSARAQGTVRGRQGSRRESLGRDRRPSLLDPQASDARPPLPGSEGGNMF